MFVGNNFDGIICLLVGLLLLCFLSSSMEYYTPSNDQESKYSLLASLNNECKADPSSNGSKICSTIESYLDASKKKIDNETKKSIQTISAEVAKQFTNDPILSIL